VSGPRIITAETRGRDETRAGGHSSGRFASRLDLENKVNQSTLQATRRRLSEHPIEQIGEKLRG